MRRSRDDGGTLGNLWFVLAGGREDGDENSQGPAQGVCACVFSGSCPPATKEFVPLMHCLLEAGHSPLRHSPYKPSAHLHSLWQSVLTDKCF